MGQIESNWFCAQLGKREHYAIPRALHRQGKLARLCTDFWATPRLRTLLQNIPASPARMLADRFHTELANAPVTAWNLRALIGEIRLRQAPRKGPEGIYHEYNAVGRRFAESVRAELQRVAARRPAPVFFAYDTGALESLQWCRENKVPCVLDQIDPGRVETDLVCAEERAWPGWAIRPTVVPTEYFARREQEWKLADRIIVNSRWSREALIKQGVAEHKLIVVPLSYEPPLLHSEPGARDLSLSHRQPLRVLFLGQVILRKGIQHLIQAARMLDGENIRFDIVGTIGISADALRHAPKNVRFHGRASNDQARAWYRQSDVFVLPTLSDGFAITQLEAMAHGLPVVATDCCGDVVTDGADGFIVPTRDAAALARSFQRYLADRGLLAAQSAAARVKAGQFTSARLVKNLVQIEAGLIRHTTN